MTTQKQARQYGGFDDLDLLTPAEAAQKCRVGVRTVQRAIANGELEAINLDRGQGWPGHRIRRSALREWQERGLPSGVRNRCSSRLEHLAPSEEDAA